MPTPSFGVGIFCLIERESKSRVESGKFSLSATIALSPLSLCPFVFLRGVALRLCFLRVVALLYLYEAVLYGIDHKVCSVFAPCLFEDVGAMLIHRALRDKELVGDLLVR